MSVGQAHEDGQAEAGVGATVDRLDDGCEVGRDSTGREGDQGPVSYTHLRAHETVLDLVCRLLLEKKNTAPTSIHNLAK